MGSEKKKQAGPKAVARPGSKQKAPPPALERVPPREPDIEPIRWDEIPGLEASGEPDPKEVDETTNQVLDHVLRRFGWARDERGRLEHVGEEEARGLKKAS